MNKRESIKEANRYVGAISDKTDAGTFSFFASDVTPPHNNHPYHCRTYAAARTKRKEVRDRIAEQLRTGNGE